MNPRKVGLQISQVQRAIDECRSDFPDERQDIYNQLLELFDAVKHADIGSYEVDLLKFTRDLLYRIFHSIEHLDYADEDELPKELTYALDLIKNEWIENPKDYFVVISYNNRLNNFYIDALPEGARIQYNLNCLALFGKTFKQSLIQISKPRFLAHDYLGSVPVYHELGHFIDLNYQITQSMFNDKTGYKPELDGTDRLRQLNHIREYFADIFSAQYLGRSSLEALSYIAHKNPSTFTHPGTDKRIEIVNTFIDGTGSEENLKIVNKLIEQTEKRTKGRKLEQRMQALTTSPFRNSSPAKLNNQQEVHSLFSEGWEYLLIGDFIEEDKDDPNNRCKRINTLIRESIQMSF